VSAIALIAAPLSLGRSAVAVAFANNGNRRLWVPALAGTTATFGALACHQARTRRDLLAPPYESENVSEH
jgi:hypothetical protein